jgi:hypothetical protein
MPYTTLQSASDEGFPSGQQHYLKASYLKDLTEEAIEVLAHLVCEMPSPDLGVGLQQMHGAASHLDPAATAFPHSDDHYELLILSQWADPSGSEGNVRWTRQLFEAMRTFFGEGVYVNNLGEEEQERVKEAYGDHYERLVPLKDTYDPTNLFRLNQNVKPMTHNDATSLWPGEGPEVQEARPQRAPELRPVHTSPQRTPDHLLCAENPIGKAI